MEIFDKELVLVPILEEEHFFVLVIIRPGLVARPDSHDKPFILVLDSLWRKQNKAVDKIRQYLKGEWRRKHCSGEQHNHQYEFNTSEMITVRPNPPKQPNGFDCGKCFSPSFEG